MSKPFYLAILLTIATGEALAQTSPVKADTLFIAADGDTLQLKKDDYYTIKNHYPELLYTGFPAHPDLMYASRKSGDDFLFDSEAGHDFYCMVYAFFLKQRNGVERYALVRDTMNRLFNNLNLLFGELGCGGSYYGHMEARIPGYAEYTVYLYSLYDVFNPLNIGKQKKHYIALLRQILEDEMVVDDDSVDCSAGRRQKLINAIESIDSLITNKFLLEQAIAFQANLSSGF